MKREFEGILAFNPDDAKNMEKCKGSSMTIPHQGIDVGLIMERANNGLPISPIPDSSEICEDEDFSSDAYRYYDFSDEFEIIQARIDALERYKADLEAQQAKQSESAASE